MKHHIVPDPALAERLAIRRREAGLTQNDVALRLRISESRVTKIETARIAPPADLVAAIEAVLAEAEGATGLPR
jgi:transcriptional regulator with XRE-family HTH domain